MATASYPMKEHQSPPPAYETQVSGQEAPTNDSAMATAPYPMHNYPDQPPGYQTVANGGYDQVPTNDSAIPNPLFPTKGYPTQPPVQYLPGPPAQSQNVTGVQGLCVDLPPTAQNVEIEFFKQPVKVVCNNCSAYEYTRVVEKINTGGWFWIVLCCCCGIWCLGFMVKCMDGFRIFNHHCQTCGKKIGAYRPSFSAGKILLLILLAVFTVMLVAVVVYAELAKLQKNRGSYPYY